MSENGGRYLLRRLGFVTGFLLVAGSVATASEATYLQGALVFVLGLVVLFLSITADKDEERPGNERTTPSSSQHHTMREGSEDEPMTEPESTRPASGLEPRPRRGLDISTGPTFLLQVIGYTAMVFAIVAGIAIIATLSAFQGGLAWIIGLGVTIQGVLSASMVLVFAQIGENLAGLREQLTRQ